LHLFGRAISSTELISQAFFSDGPNKGQNFATTEGRRGGENPYREAVAAAS